MPVMYVGQTDINPEVLFRQWLIRQTEQIEQFEKLAKQDSTLKVRWDVFKQELKKIKKKARI